MVNLEMGLVGCGGMGLRHLYGLKALREVSGTTDPTINIAAVCDPNRENAEYLADYAVKLLGVRPKIFASQAEMLQNCPEIEAVNITTSTETHHTLVVQALETGQHVLVEKPLAATIAGCNLALEAATHSGKVLAVAENVRRDPQHRLVRALLQDKAIGQPYLIVDYVAAGGNAIMLTPWRHKKETGGVMLDVAVHNADLMRYYLGDIEWISGYVKLLEQVRYRADKQVVVSEFFYQKWRKELPPTTEATAEDLMLGFFGYANGTTGQWTFLEAAHGEKRNFRLIYGSAGVLEIPPDRSGGKLTLRRNDTAEAISGDELLAYAPSYRLDPLTLALFGRPQPAGYNFSFEEIDQKLVALELADFAQAVTQQVSPEVDGLEGRKAVALVYAFFESALLERKVTLAEIEADTDSPYQREVNQILGL